MLGIIKVSEAASGHDERSSKGDANAFDRGEQIHLLLVLRLGQRGKILFEVLNLLFKEGDGFLDRLLALGIKERQSLHRAFQVPCGDELLLELADDSTLLLQSEDGITAELVGSGLHLLAIEGNQACVNLIRLDGG